MKTYTVSINVDIENGQVITNKEKNNHYYTIKKQKHAKITSGQYGNVRIIEITNECRRKPEQGKLL